MQTWCWGGSIPPHSPAASIALDRAGAVAAVSRNIGDTLQLSAEMAALGISEMVDENMANAARVHAIESGKDARDRVLIAFGGAAPLHAARVAEKLGIVPHPRPGQCRRRLGGGVPARPGRL